MPLKFHAGVHVRPNGFAGLILAMLMVAAYINWGFPSGFIVGNSPYWLMENQDITAYVAGFMAFFQEPWHWPLLRIESINWPEGTLATFVDAIPLFALLLKLFVPTSVGPFNPYGYWIGLCLVLQAVGGWWALREAGVNRWSALIGLTCLLLTMPILQHRLGHVSLFSQWILVFGMALTLRSERLGKTSAGWCPLLLSALYINVYLLAMSGLLYAVDLWRHRCKPTPIQWALWPLLTLLAAGVSLWVTMWPMPGHHLAQDEGFGIYSMNLLAPITGSRFFTLTSPTVSDPQAVEGFNYLGVGVMILLAWLWRTRDQASAMAQAPAPVLSRARVFWGLMLLLTLYALSNRVSFGSFQILEWTLPDRAKLITGPLRASGRFFWPVVYAVTIFGVIAAARRLRQVPFLILMFVVTAFQITDRWTGIQALYGKGMPTDAFHLDHDAWKRTLGDSVKTIYFYPKMRCAKQSSFYDTLLPTMRYAAEHGIKITSGYIARYAPDCAAMAAESRSSDPRQSAYVFVNKEYTPEQIPGLLPPANAWACHVVDFATICSVHPNGATP